MTKPQAIDCVKQYTRGGNVERYFISNFRKDRFLTNHNGQPPTPLTTSDQRTFRKFAFADKASASGVVAGD